MADLKTFAKRIKKIGKDVETNADKLVRKAALAIDATVVLATPVDTGRARANWQVELDGPAGGTVEPTDRSGQAAISQAQATVPHYKGGTSQASIHITNNLPYIGKLNDGHSAQAPAGYVERAVNIGIEAVRGASVIRSET